jgi:hypothetical protein
MIVAIAGSAIRTSHLALCVLERGRSVAATMTISTNASNSRRARRHPEQRPERATGRFKARLGSASQWAWRALWVKDVRCSTLAPYT